MELQRIGRKGHEENGARNILDGSNAQVTATVAAMAACEVDGQKERKAMNPHFLEKERYELVDMKVHAASQLLTAGRTQEALDTMLTASFWLRRLKEIDDAGKERP